LTVTEVGGEDHTGLVEFVEPEPPVTILVEFNI